MTQLDLLAALAARDEALARVEQHANDAWKAEAMRAVVRVARERGRFTTDDVWQALGGLDVGTHEPRAMGAVMRQAARNGWVRATDEYVKSGRAACHARPLRVWESGV
jgi:hypothetical protein